MIDLVLPALGGVFATLFTIGYLHDTNKWLWNRARKWGPQHKELLKAKAAVTDMVTWKEQRRNEDRQKWRNEFEALGGGRPEPQPLSEPLISDGPDEQVIRSMGGNVIRITPSGQVPWPAPPRGGSGVSKPMRVNQPETIMVGTDMAYPVRMGKYVGHYVIRHDDYDSLLDADNWRVLKSYDGGHYSTCPYECDCPQWARRY